MKANLVNILVVAFLTRCSSNLMRMFVLIMSRSGSNMGHVGSKNRSQGHINGKPCELSRGSILTRCSSNLMRMFVLMMSWSRWNIGHKWSKTRSRGQRKGKKNLVNIFKGHIYDWIFMKLDENVCLDAV